MTDKATTVRSWGIGLILIALILPLLGLFGEQFMEKRHQRVRGERALEQWNARQALMASYEERMKTAFAELDEQPLNEEWDMTTGPVVEIPEQVIAAAREVVEGYRDELQEQFPDIEQVTRIEFSFVASRAEASPRFVTAASPGLPREAGLYPDRFNLYGSQDSDRIPISLHLPSGRRTSMDSQPGQRWLEYYNRAELLIDRVEEEEVGITRMMIAGVQVRAQLQSFGGEAGITSTRYSMLAGLFDMLGLIGLVLLALIPPVWVYVDASLRRQPALLWFLFTLPTSVLGALIYALVTRDSGKACPECGERVSPRYVVCPYCQTELKGTCPNCGQTVGHDWSYCPSCSTEL